MVEKKRPFVKGKKNQQKKGNTVLFNGSSEHYGLLTDTTDHLFAKWMKQDEYEHKEKMSRTEHSHKERLATQKDRFERNKHFWDRRDKNRHSGRRDDLVAKGIVTYKNGKLDSGKNAGKQFVYDDRQGGYVPFVSKDETEARFNSELSKLYSQISYSGKKRRFFKKK